MILDPFFWRPLLAALLLAGTAAPLGAFVVWRRMAYFGEALAHAVLPGVALAVALGLAPTLTLPPFVLLLAGLLLLLERHSRLPADTLLAILAHGALAGGLLALSLAGGYRTDLLGYLFGDVLAVDSTDLALLAVAAAVVTVLLTRHWRGLVSATVSEELAAVEGVPVVRLRLLLVLLMALVVALGLRVVGILLVMALLIVPPAAVRPWVREPEQMALGALAFGVAAAWLGLELAFRLDLPAGPAIAVVAVVGFFTSIGLARMVRPAEGPAP